MEKEKLLLARVSDKIKQYKKTGETTYTSFLDPAEQMECENILRDIPHALWGGYDGAERKIAIIGDDLVPRGRRLSLFLRPRGTNPNYS